MKIIKWLLAIFYALIGVDAIMARYTADFETTTDPDDCRVWAWGICDIDDPEHFEHGNDLDSFIERLKRDKWVNNAYYFHNLKFDSEFLLSWLFSHGYRHITDRREATAGTFTTLISDKGAFYSMTIWFARSKHKTHKAVFYDSLKVLPMSVAAVAKSFGLPIGKLEIDYHEKRERGHELTGHEIEYLKADVRIMALALGQLFGRGLDRMTTGSNALYDYKGIFGKAFGRLFPVLDYETDQNMRPAYKGGFCYLKPDEAGKDQGAGMVFDVNSLYPSVMYHKPLPVGFPVPFKKKYRPNRQFPLFVQVLRCGLRIKPGHLPTVQLKKSYFFGSDGEYLYNTGGDDITLYLTNMDIELLFEHYDVMNPEYLGGMMFRESRGLFKTYIDKWSQIKVESKQAGNKGMYTLAKLMLNSLYGKFALNPNVMSNIPYFDGEVVRYKKSERETRDGIYLPVGLFITSWARYVTISAGQRLFDRFIYADTDSLHIKGLEPAEGLDVDPVRLGAWKHELIFDRARYIRAKTYIEHGSEPGSNEPAEWKITAAGMPDNCKAQVTPDNFIVGAVFGGKLMPRHVPGGIVLIEDTFTIRG